jgi:large subunit ribosomal protein L13
MRATHPTRILEHAIAGMLPKNKLGKQMYRKLKVYAGDKHPHQAQKPVDLSVT